MPHRNTSKTTQTSKRDSQILVTTEVSITNMPLTPTSILQSRPTRSDSHVSFTGPPHPEPIPSPGSVKKRMTMADIDAKQEAKMAKEYRKRRHTITDMMRDMPSTPPPASVLPPPYTRRATTSAIPSNTSSNSHISFDIPARPVYTPQLASDKKRKTIGQIDKEKEVKMAKAHCKRKELAEKLRGCFVRAVASQEKGCFRKG